MRAQATHGGVGRKGRDRRQGVRAWLFLVVALPLFSAAVTAVLAVRASRREGSLRRGGEQAAGTVVAMKPTGPDGAPGLFPEVRFTTSSGKSVRGVSQTPIQRAYPANVPIEVVYDPASPSQFQAGPSRARIYRVATVLFALAGTLALVFISVARG